MIENENNTVDVNIANSLGIEPTKKEVVDADIHQIIEASKIEGELIRS